MFRVAWGERAIELVDRYSAGAAIPVERCGRLAVADARGATDGAWRCWISGRLSNTRELCERVGLPPTSSAPAAIARAYSRLGRDACELLRGTFVVVALDREREAATVVRDHLGGRPLVYARVGRGALLSEHEREIVDLLPGAPEPDRLALAQWIERGSIPAGRTLFESVRRVAPAHRLLLGEDGVSVERYWLPRYEGVAEGSRGEIAERLRGAAFAAVERAAQAVEKPAILLSGGLDSSCVAAGLAARKPHAAPALALAGVFPAHPQTDERELIKATALHTGLPVELIAFDERSSILAPALEHIDRWGLPPVTPNLFAWQPLMARARELGVDGMLDGEGGDELFGFAPLLIAEELRRGRLLAAWRLTRRIPGIGGEADGRMRVRALRVYGTGRLLPAAVKRRRERMRAARSRQSLLSEADEMAIAELEADAPPRLEGPMWWRGLAERLTQPGETLGVSAHLRREAIDEGIDRRHPFLFDLDLLTTALGNPPEMQFEARDRALLRDGLSGYIPESVRTRHEKSFFNSLLSAGLAVDGARISAGPARADAPVRDIVRGDRLEELLRAGPAPRDGRAARRLWHVGMADVWLRSLAQPQYPLDLLDGAVAPAGK